MVCEDCQFRCHHLHDYRASECEIDAGKPCTECLALEEIDMQVCQLHGLIASLIRKRLELKAKINRRHDPFHYRLPPEITSQVFAHCVARIDVQDQTLPIENAHEPILWFPMPVFGHKAGKECPQMTLRAVCATWAQAALATPQLWQYLRVELGMNSLSKLVRTMVERSGDLPLDICISGSPPAESEEETLQALDILKRCSFRWRHVHLYIPSPLAQMLTTDLSGMQRLATLSFYPSSRPPPAEEAKEKYLLSNAHHLQHLRTHNVFLPQIEVCWRNITHYYNMFTSEDEVIEILRLAPSLTHCEVSTQGDEGVYLLSEIVHPALRNFSYTCNNETESQDFVYPLLRYIQLPSLERFVYRVREQPTAHRTIEALETFFTHANHNQLTYFSVFPVCGDGYATESELLQVFQLIPSVTHLSIKHHRPYAFQITDSFLAAFQRHTAGHDAALATIIFPRLEGLEIEGSCNFAWKSILDIFGGNLGSAGQRTLRSIVITLLSGFPQPPPMDQEALNCFIEGRRGGLHIELKRTTGEDYIEQSLAAHRMSVSTSDM